MLLQSLPGLRARRDGRPRAVNVKGCQLPIVLRPDWPDHTRPGFTDSYRIALAPATWPRWPVDAFTWLNRMPWPMHQVCKSDAGPTLPRYDDRTRPAASMVCNQ